MFYILLFIFSVNVATAHEDYVYKNETGSYYKLHEEGASWSAARDKCRSENATLIVIQNEKEAEICASLLVEAKVEKAFVGIHALPNGSFVTVLDTPLESVYSVWDEGEPNNRMVGEDCVDIRFTGKLNDEKCSWVFAFICKKSVIQHEENQCNKPYKDYFYDVKSDTCIKFQKKSRSWIEAFSLCDSEDSHLGIVNSDDEATHYAGVIKQYVGDKGDKKLKVHLGYYDLFHSGYLSVSGKKIKHDNTVDLENVRCPAMTFGGELVDNRCTAETYFICEHEIAR